MELQLRRAAVAAATIAEAQIETGLRSRGAVRKVGDYARAHPIFDAQAANGVEVIDGDPPEKDWQQCV